MPGGGNDAYSAIWQKTLTGKHLLSAQFCTFVAHAAKELSRAIGNAMLPYVVSSVFDYVCEIFKLYDGKNENSNLPNR